ncbi:SDR family oxidoreductase [Thalassiella azotivora]
MTVVAVTGATGKTGRAVTAALRRAGVTVRAVSRDPSRSGAARGGDDGVTPAPADLATGEGLRTALAGADALYLLAPNVAPDEPGMVRRALEAATAAGVRRVVYHSVAQPYAPSMPHHVDKAASEDLVRRSGLGWTVLQPCAYAQNLVEPLRGEEPELAVPYDVTTPFGLVDLLDVAEVAVQALTRPGHHGATYELGGPRLVSVADVADAAAQVLGRRVRARRIDPTAWAQGPGAALPDDARRRLLAMFAHYDRYGLPAGSRVLTALLERPGTDVRDVLVRELA